MTVPLHIIASCTSLKRLKPQREQEFRRIKGASVNARFRAWRRRLDSASHHTLARELYAGQHWSAVLELEERALDAGFDTYLWIASAGHGLTSSSASIASYSATFALGPDSVSRSALSVSEERRAWWSLLSVKDATSTSIARLARQDPYSRILFVGSAPYVDAVALDLKAAAAALKRPEHLIVVSSTLSSKLNELAPFSVACEARLQRLVGGGVVSLHARVAADLVSFLGHKRLNAVEARSRVRYLLGRCTHRRRKRREPATDSSIQAFIRKQLAREQQASRTLLLRALREAGVQCEAQRFALLYDKVLRTP